MHESGDWLQKEAPKSFYKERFEFNVNVTEGAGVVASADLEDDKLFLSMPRKCIMSTDTCVAAKVGGAIKGDRMCVSMPSLSLAVHLVMEALDEESYWRPYIDVLPREHDLNLALYYTLDELKQLQGSPTYYDALKLHKSTVRQYIHVYSLLKRSGHLHLPTLTFEDFRWAVVTVMSRQNNIPSKDDPNKVIISLIPAFDHCNFRAGKPATYYNTNDDRSESFTMEAVKKGEPIYIHFGDRPNSKLFIFSGFVFDEHATDSVEFTLSLPDAEKDPLHKLRQLLLSKHAMQGTTGFSCPLPMVGQPEFEALMTYLRIAVMDKTEATTALKAKSTTGKGAGLAKLSERNECEAWKFLLKRVNGLIRAYDQTAIASADDDTKNNRGSASAGKKEEKTAEVDAAMAASRRRVLLAKQMCRTEMKLLIPAMAKASAKVQRLTKLIAKMAQVAKKREEKERKRKQEQEKVDSQAV